MALAAGLSVVVATTTWSVTLLRSWSGCFFDTSNCAASDELRRYRGRVFDYEGRPAPRTRLAFDDDLYGEHFEFRFATDDRGRFCVLAIPGRFAASVTVPGQRHISQHIVRSTAPPDPRFASERVRERIRRIRVRTRYAGPIRFAFIVMEPVPGSVVPQASWASPTGAHEAVFLWNEQTDAAPRCERVDGSPPWYRFEGHPRSWQYVALTVVPWLTLSLFAFGIGARRCAQRHTSAGWARRAQRGFQATCGAGLASAVLFVVLWELV